jgi:two-component system, chemotaxis family, chemotaxis protein CheY
MATVLIVDDAAFMRMVLKKILTENNYEVVGEAGTGEIGIQQYKSLRPDIVTMDITMPDMGGLTAVTEIKKIDPAAKIIMCSAMGQQAMIVEAIRAGAADFIVKPFQEERVLESLRRILGQDPVHN